MRKALYLLASLSWLLTQQLAQAQAQTSEAPATGLANPQTAAEEAFFTNEKELRFTLHLPLDELLKDKGRKPVLHNAALQYQDAVGATRMVPVQVKLRGHRRQDPAVCQFPPLLIHFPDNGAHPSMFGKMADLKLTTHCRADNYVLREYLVYKLYNALTDMSFRVRLCLVTYQDMNSRQKATVHQAFLLEEASAMAQRNKATIVPKPLIIGMQYTHQESMAMLTLFQYMIGNTDWSVPYRHNIRLLKADGYAAPVPVPYDFDYAGLVMAPYAEPPQQLGITSVRQRLFRGYNFTEELYTKMRALFNERRAALYNVYLSCEYLNRDEKAFATQFLDEFYDTLNDPKEFERSIVRVGRRNEKQYISIKGYD
ncbi:hypothetical protein HMJ29_03100 [Hymenobacter taeanensis]|uniref:Uncharacterized protein n=1 Tax=Hymenobacter taeanensis TaxID=2735321 RepID=A0A6M6BCR1_9BACT|nr:MULTISPECIES: hypothetical protein [Hymenobacter]QJX45976.1 hypothetical protein HMJ29_03100 [Hymenobacter taeanensis]UOQ79825.1 hypothetical protein MUN83_13330 [Hymenobacter sp. 5414T-23]